MAERTRIDVSTPLVNEFFEETEEAKRVIETLSDEKGEFDLHIHVDSMDMVPTVLVMSMSKRHNVEYYAHLNRFDGIEYVHGYLLSGYFKGVDFNI